MNTQTCLNEPNRSAIIRRCNTFGLRNFILLAETKVGEVTVIFEKVTLNDALQLNLHCIAQTLEMYAQRPETSETEKAYIKTFATDLTGLVKKLQANLK